MTQKGLEAAMNLDELVNDHVLRISTWPLFNLSRGHCSCGWKSRLRSPGWRVARDHVEHFRHAYSQAVRP